MLRGKHKERGVNMKRKLLSIIVPSYNMEKYLGRCLESFLVPSNLMERLEVLVINDGSKDSTSEIAHNFEMRFPGIVRAIDKENGNYGSCVERGLAEAEGKYVKTVDADDWVDNENFAKYLSYIISVADNAEGPDLILNDFEFVGPDMKPIKRMSYSFVLEPDFTVAGFTYKNDRAMWMHAAAYKTEKLRAIGYTQMHGVSYTDEEWISLPMTTVETIGYFPDVVYEYLLGREGQTCAPDEYLKGFWMQIKILKKLIGQYVDRQRQWGAAQEQYMRNHLKHRVELTYRNCLYVNSPYLKDETAVDFDEFLTRTCKWLYEAADACVISDRVRFHYVSFWRRHGRKKDLHWRISLFVAKILRKIVG